MDPSIPVLVLFCKEPRLGYGKQRLAANIGQQYALRVARALLDCALEDAANWDGTFVFSPASPAEVVWARRLSAGSALGGGPAHIIAQTNGNLGRRIEFVDFRLRELGAAQIIYMGCDAPALEDTHYDGVLAALADVDVALANGTDGGVTLMASRSGWPPLEALPWSTGELGNALAHSCAASGRSVHRLDGCFDVDDKDDALRLLQHLENDPRPARQNLRDVLRAVFAVQPET